MLQLTPEDVSRLLSQDDGAARVDVALKVTGNYCAAQFDEREAVLAEQIFRLMMRDTEVQVRAMLAEQLKESKALPRDIVLSMARDVLEVALPVLKYSEVLTDDDLVVLVRGTGETKRHLAVSERKRVSAQVAGALVDTGKKEVAASLLDNPGADLHEGVLTRIFDRFSKQKTVMNQLAKRPSLPLPVAEKLVTVVSRALAEQLKIRYRMGEDAVRPAAERVREASTLSMLKANPTPHEVEKLVEQLSEGSRLTASIVFTGLCEGHMLFFEMALAKLAGLPHENTRTLLNDRGSLGFRAVYNKSGLPSGMFSAVRKLLSAVQELQDTTDVKRGPAFANRVVEKLLAGAEEEPVENLSYIIALVRKSLQ